jgi:hypothetical protein
MEMQIWQLFGLIVLKIKGIPEEIFRICSVSIFRFYKIFRCSKYFYPDKHVGVMFVNVVMYEWEFKRLDIYF